MTNLTWQFPTASAFNVAFNLGDITVIINNDLQLFLKGKVSNPNRYRDLNKGQYFVITNLWYNLGKDVLGYDEGEMSIFRHALLKKGLLQLIADASSYSSAVINSQIDNCASSVFYEMASHLDFSHEIDALRKLHTFLKFPSRFSPVGIDGYTADACSEFVTIQGRIKGRDHFSNPSHIILELRKIARDICKGFNLHYDSFGYTSGAARDSERFLSTKVKALMNYDGRCLPESYSIKPVPSFIDTNDHILSRTVTLTGVNKNYKIKRIVAPEVVATQYRAIGIKDELRRCVLRYQKKRQLELTCYDDQSLQRNKAFLGSVPVFGCSQPKPSAYATIDFSRASDYISKSLILDIFPSDISREIEAVWPLHYEYNGIRPMYSFSTMGNAITWDLMNILFICIGIYSIDTYCSLARCTKAARRVYLETLSVFGDDVILHNDIAEFFIDICQRLGLKVNVDKSYYTDIHYRESCGEEYFSGFNISAKYWPRHDIVIPVDREGNIHALDSFNDRVDQYTGEHLDWLSSIVSLERRLYEYPTCRNFLCDIVFAVCPQFTTSLCGDDSTVDLWYPFEITHTVSIPGTQHTREEHIQLVPVRSTTPIHVIENRKHGMESYYYQKFLKYGPNFLSELDRLLGVSSPFYSESDFIPQKVHWSFD
jgi:hypothetical protein